MMTTLEVAKPVLAQLADAFDPRVEGSLPDLLEAVNLLPGQSIVAQFPAFTGPSNEIMWEVHDRATRGRDPNAQKFMSEVLSHPSNSQRLRELMKLFCPLPGDLPLRLLSGIYPTVTSISLRNRDGQLSAAVTHKSWSFVRTLFNWFDLPFGEAIKIAAEFGNHLQLDLDWFMTNRKEAAAADKGKRWEWQRVASYFEFLPLDLQAHLENGLRA